MSIGTREKKEAPPIPVARPTTSTEMAQAGVFARQRPSALGRITFWVSVIRVLGGMGALIPFIIASGGLSTAQMSIYLITGSSLAIVILMATRMRWAPLVSILPALVVSYVTFTQPFALFDLANPKGPNGGFITFVVGVVAFAFSLLVVISSIGATIENYGRNRQALRWLPSTALSLVAGLLISAIFIGALAQPASNGTSYVNGVPAVHMGAGGFLQSSVTISKGSKLVLVDDTTVTHNLFNGSWHNSTPQVAQEPGAPLVNNVQLSGNSITVGPFSVAGTYHIFCTIHQGMNLTIIVQ